MASTTHDKGVQTAKIWLASQGYAVKGAPETGGHIADAYGEKVVTNNGKSYVDKAWSRSRPPTPSAATTPRTR